MDIVSAISSIVMNIIIFIALYVEVFLLITYFEVREKESKNTNLKMNLEQKDFLSTSIIIPVWNEEKTVLKTVRSILDLDYPKDKLFIYIVDDGSTDGTWKTIQQYEGYKNIKLLRKENGGKHTALNYALSFINTDLVGCLDADSEVHKEALKRIVYKFKDPKIMAVTPSIKIVNPFGILGMLQKAEYMFGIFLRKVLSHLDALYITPVLFSIFIRKVFYIVGPYKKAHNTEDMEIAVRMQRHGMKISNVHDAFVYTVAPTTLYKLYKQRLRWVYGFLKNAIDYRDMFFRPKYGNLGMIILPAAGFSFLSTLFLFTSSVLSASQRVFTYIKQFITVGFSWNGFNFDFFYINTNTMVFVSIIALLGTLFIITTSRSLAEEKTKFGMDSVFFLALYTVIAPLWMTRAIYNVIFSKKTTWR